MKYLVALIYRWTFVLVLVLMAAVPLPASANALEQCLQKRLDAVLSGAQVSKHTNISGLMHLVLGKKNMQKIEDNTAAVTEFENTIVAVIAARIAEKAGEVAGATLTLPPSKDKYSIEGTVTVKGQEYPINITFPDKKTCRINDVSVAGLFHLKVWVRDQSEVKRLMKRYKMTN